MATTGTPAFALQIGFNENAEIVAVRYPDGSVMNSPLGSFDTGYRLDNINLLKVEELSILVYERRKDDGTLEKVYCPHHRCRVYC